MSQKTLQKRKNEIWSFTQDKINFTTTFKPIDTKKNELKMKHPDSKVVILPLDRNYSSSSLFFSIFDDEFLDQLIEYNSIYPQHLPLIFSKYQNTRKYPNIQQEKRNLVIQFYATKLFINANPKLTLRENFSSGKSIKVPNYEHYSMTFDIKDCREFTKELSLELFESL
jgi:hypothetical protein